MTKCVLVVDDDPSFRTLVRAALESLGVTDICEATSGEEAADWFRQLRFDLIVTDWRMPGRNGLRLTESIRLIAPQVPIVMITVVDETPQMMEALKSGVSAYVTKPCTLDEIREALSGYIAAPC